MLTLQPEILQAMVYGDRQPHLVALLVPDPEEMNRFQGDEAGMAKALSKAVDRVNADLSVIEKVRRFILADEAFSVENDQLTPSMKIRRHIIRGVYGERLEALYRR
jgi:long-chain acyl-CoA synthetase